MESIRWKIQQQYSYRSKIWISFYGIHPLENTATVFISFKDLDKFLWNLDVDVVKIKL